MIHILYQDHVPVRLGVLVSLLGFMLLSGTIFASSNPMDLAYAGPFVGNPFSMLDRDNDRVLNHIDNCPNKYNPDQKDIDGDKLGDVCDPYIPDDDRDGVLNSQDNCIYNKNPDQKDTDRDNIGDACDNYTVDPLDADADGVNFYQDNCKYTYNPGQDDRDEDGKGDECDGDTPNQDADQDGIVNELDNCPEFPNRDQDDADEDDIGDACETGIIYSQKPKNTIGERGSGNLPILADNESKTSQNGFQSDTGSNAEVATDFENEKINNQTDNGVTDNRSSNSSSDSGNGSDVDDADSGQQESMEETSNESTNVIEEFENDTASN